MYCASCPYNVENVLKDTPGVANATVGFIGKEIVNGTVEGRGEVVYDSTKTNLEKIIKAILPYKGTTLTDEKTNSTFLSTSERINSISSLQSDHSDCQRTTASARMLNQLYPLPWNARFPL